MLDALLSSIPDTAFFAQHDFAETIREQYLDSDTPFGCMARGPSLWDPRRHPDYPVYALCKINNEDNKDFLPFRDAVLVVSSVETGECQLFAMQEDEGKMPLFGNKGHARPKSDLPVVQSFSVREKWRTLSANRFPGAHGVYTAYIHVGNFQSRPFTFEVLSYSSGSEKTAFEKRLELAETDPEMNAVLTPRIIFESASDTTPPSPPGVTFKIVHGSGNGHQGIEELRATFRLNGKWKPGWQRVPFHLLISVPGGNRPLLHTVFFPLKHARIDEHGYSGSFHFNLADLFAMAPGEKPKLPASAWVGFLHRDWQGPLKRVDFAVPGQGRAP